MTERDQVVIPRYSHAGDDGGVVRRGAVRTLARSRAAGDRGARRDRGRARGRRAWRVRARAPRIDAAFVEAVLEREAVTDHDVAAFVDVVQDSIGSPEGSWIHYGLTSTDVVDTALCWAMRDAVDRADRGVDGVAAHARRPRPRPSRHRDDRQDPRHPRRAHDVRRQGRAVGAAGRPRSITVDVRARGRFGDEAQRRGRDVLEHPARSRGTRRSGPRPDPRTRDAGGRARPPRRVPLGLRRGRNDVRGGGGGAPAPAAHRGERGAGGLQARPEGVVGDAPQAQPDLGRDDLRARHGCSGRNLQAGLQDVALWHERDISHSSVERVVLPDSSQLAHYVMRRLTRLLSGLEILPEQMLRNLQVEPRTRVQSAGSPRAGTCGKDPR